MRARSIVEIRKEDAPHTKQTPHRSLPIPAVETVVIYIKIGIAMSDIREPSFYDKALSRSFQKGSITSVRIFTFYLSFLDCQSREQIVLIEPKTSILRTSVTYSAHIGVASSPQLLLRENELRDLQKL